jgi:polysaccharide deacetylase family protein (PEP-CTERM system associated)
VALRGHEIGSHTHSHELIFRQQPAAFRADVERSLTRLEDLTGRAVIGFRAPEFSVVHLRHWCFEVLAELGFLYDSSVFPVPRVRYGIPEAPRYPFVIETPGGEIHEYPLATWDAGGFRLPVAGGSYFRLLPGGLLRRAIADVDAEGRTAVLYVHPYEFHTGWLVLPRSAWRRALSGSDPKIAVSRILLHNFRTGVIAQRLGTITKHFAFAPLGEIHEARSKRGQESGS